MRTVASVMPQSGKSRTLRELGQMFFTRWPGFVIIVAALTAGTYYACTYATKHYRSRVTLLLAAPGLAGSATGSFDADHSPELLVNTAQTVFSSDRVLARACALIEQPALRSRWNEVSRTGRPVDNDLRSDLDAAAERYLAGEPGHRRTLRRFRSRVQMEPAPAASQCNSQVFTIGVCSPAPPSNASLAARTLAQVLGDRLYELQAKRSRSAIALLEQRLEDLEAKLLAPAREEFEVFVAEAQLTPADLAELGQAEANDSHASGAVLADAGRLTEFQALRDNWQQARRQCQQLQAELVAARTFAGQLRQAMPILWLDGPGQADRSRPAWPIRWLFTLIAAAAGLVLGTVYTLAGYRYDYTLRNPHDVERFIGLPVLGSVRRHRRGLI